LEKPREKSEEVRGSKRAGLTISSLPPSLTAGPCFQGEQPGGKEIETRTSNNIREGGWNKKDYLNHEKIRKNKKKNRSQAPKQRKG